MPTETTQTSAATGLPQERGSLPRSRQGHEALVVRLLREHGPLTRSELGTLCGLSRTTLYDAVGALMDQGAVLASIPAVARRKRGRPAEVLALNPRSGLLLAVEYVKADVSGRLMINAMSTTAYTELLTTPDMAAINRPVTA